MILGIFSWIFSKNTESSSLVRKWVAQEMEQVDTTNPDAYGLFVGLIQAAVQWGKKGIEEQDEKLLQVAKQYLGDATIFEIACYTYYQVENWLTKNQPEYKSEIALPIRKWIVEKFYTTLYVDEQQVNQLFTERLERYMTITGEGKGIEELHLEVEQCILMTKGDKFDKRSLPKDPSSTALDSQYIKPSLAKYEEIHIPAVIESIQDYCSKNAKVQLRQKQNQEQSHNQNQDHKDYLYGMALVAQKDWIRACKAFTRVLDASPEHYDALLQRGLLYVAMYQSVEAVQDFTRAIQVNPNKSIAYLHRGKCYHRNFRQKDKSLDDYSMAIQLAPRDAEAYFGRGQLYDDIALSAENKALEDHDHAKYAHVSEEFLAAINDYSQVVALEPEHDSAYVSRGLAYARKARVNKNVDFIEKAIEDLERAISLNWENGYLYKQQDEMKELLEPIRSSEGQADEEVAVPQERNL